jgi:hypothetical protein
VVLQPTNNKFVSCIANIEKEVKNMEKLKDVAHEAQTSDIKEFVQGTGQGSRPISNEVISN